jgi:hypothetical protein
MLKSYFTKCLTETSTFDEASTYCKEIRQVFCHYPERFEFPLLRLSSFEKKSILLCPLIYRYYRDMNVPATLSIKARNLIYCVLIKKERNDKEWENKTREYLDAFHSFETEDRKELQEELFSTRWDLTTTTSFLTMDSPLYPRVQELISKIQRWIEQLEWEQEYAIYIEKRRIDEKIRVYEIMEKAFWDQMESNIMNQEYKMVEDTWKEFFLLLKDIPHPQVIDYEGYLQDLLDMDMSILMSNTEDSQRRLKIFSIFQQIFQYIKEADSEEFEILYEELDKQFKDQYEDTSISIPKLFIFALQNSYTMIYQLKAKINFYIKEKKNG